jgi:hypothetical protein
MNDFKGITKLIKDLPEGWIVMLETIPESMLDLSLLIIKYLLDNKDYFGIIVSTSRPQKNLFQLYKQKNININRLFILDCVSKSQTLNLEDSGNVLYLESVSDLTNISLAITEIMEQVQENKFVFFDSVNTMLIHNKPEVFARFIHGILTRLRINGINGLLISLANETDKEVRAEIAQLCDRVVKI